MMRTQGQNKRSSAESYKGLNGYWGRYIRRKGRTIIRSYMATPINRTPARRFMVWLCLANHLTSQSPWIRERKETMITGRPSPRPKKRKMVKALTRETLERETAIVKGSISRELQGRAITPYNPPYANAETNWFPILGSVSWGSL